MTTTGLVVICLTVVMISLLVFLGMMLRWVMTSQDRRSSTQDQTQKDLSAAMEKQVAQSVEIVRLQMELTELVLVGRPSAPTVQLQEPESPSVTLPTQDELFHDLPPNIREAMMRDIEEEATWPNPSVKQPNWSDEDRETFSTLDQEMRQRFDPFANTSPSPSGDPPTNG